MILCTVNNCANVFYDRVKGPCAIFVIVLEFLSYERMGRWIINHEFRQFNHSLCCRMVAHKSFQPRNHEGIVFSVEREDTVNSYNSGRTADHSGSIGILTSDDICSNFADTAAISASGMSSVSHSEFSLFKNPNSHPS